MRLEDWAFKLLRNPEMRPSFTFDFLSACFDEHTFAIFCAIKYTDFEGHVEFVMLGKRGDKAEGYANSGVYLQNRYEIQIESPNARTASGMRWNGQGA